MADNVVRIPVKTAFVRTPPRDIKGEPPIDSSYCFVEDLYVFIPRWKQ